MNNPIIKVLLPWVLIIGGLITAYYFFSQRANMTIEDLPTSPQTFQEQSPQQQKQTGKQQAITKTESKHIEQEKIIKQRLMEEFENAFLKQYTPPIGCENWQNDTHMVRCTNHQIKAKQVFKQEFIKTRGLPKDTFDHPQISFTD